MAKITVHLNVASAPVFRGIRLSDIAAAFNSASVAQLLYDFGLPWHFWLAFPVLYFFVIRSFPEYFFWLRLSIAAADVLITAIGRSGPSIWNLPLALILFALLAAVEIRLHLGREVYRARHLIKPGNKQRIPLPTTRGGDLRAHGEGLEEKDVSIWVSVKRANCLKFGPVQLDGDAVMTELKE